MLAIQQAATLSAAARVLFQCVFALCAQRQFAVNTSIAFTIGWSAPPAVN
jgi:hypothetical protein